jgi:hypothetical protein
MGWTARRTAALQVLSAAPSAGKARCQPCDSSNHVTVRPPRLRHPHRVARRATRWSPRPSSASLPAGRGAGTPGPLRSVTSTRMTSLAVLTATVTVSPGAPDPPCRRLLEKSSLTSRAATSPQGCPGPSTPSTNARATRARSARPASVTVSRTAPAISSTALPCPHRHGEGSGPSGGRTGMHARLGGARQAWTRRQRGPSVAVRGNADGAYRPSQLRTPTVVSARTGRPKSTDGRPLYVRGQRNMTVYSATR